MFENEVFENPNPFSDWFEIFFLLLIPFSLPRTFGKLVKDNRQGYAWQTYTARLESGWQGVHGLSTTEIRARLLHELEGPDADRRVLVAHVLGQMHELGLLMAARDSGGVGAEEARAMLAEITRPAHSD